MLNKEKINAIEARALDVLGDLKGDLRIDELVPPIDLLALVEKYGLQIKRGKFADADVSGAYDKKEKTIYVSADDSYHRQAFTIAHELGHFLLHDQKEVETFFRRDSVVFDGGKPEIEQEADWFAASLLMPRTLVEKFWHIVGNNIEEMARIFGVSASAMHYRLRNLGLV